MFFQNKMKIEILCLKKEKHIQNHCDLAKPRYVFKICCRISDLSLFMKTN